MIFLTPNFCVITILVGLVPLVRADGEAFTNPFLLKNLFIQEDKILAGLRSLDMQGSKKLIKAFDKYVESQRQVLAEVGQELSAIDPKAIDDRLLLEVVGNPIHVFKFCYRYVNIWPSILKYVKKLPDSAAAKAFMIQYNQAKKGMEWPGPNDLEGAALNLGRVQSTYVLDAIDIAHGILDDKHSNATLSVQELEFLRDERFKSDVTVKPDNMPEYALAVEWGDAALKVCEETTPDDCDDLRKKALHFRGIHDEFFQGMSPGDGGTMHPSEAFFIRKIGTDFNLTGHQLRLEEAEYFRSQRYSEDSPDGAYYVRDYYQLCRGETLRRRPNQLLKLVKYCKFSDRNNPYLKLMPLKIEVLAEKPLVHIYHDILSETEVKVIKNRAVTQFARAHTEASMASKTDGKKERHVRQIEYQRTQSIGWLNDFYEPLHKVSFKLDLACNLSIARNHYLSKIENQHETFESEQLQVGIYGPGGLYLPHLDALQYLEQHQYWFLNKAWVGNRIATAMFYLSDVGKGGTVFPKIGVGAFPTQGSVLFWYDLTLDGRIDPLSMHGACPTLYGIKWVGNKWIREGCQVFHRPCGLYQNAGVSATWMM